MRSSTTWLRISYWVGAVADGIVAAVMFAQAILALPSPLTRYVPETPSATPWASPARSCSGGPSCSSGLIAGQSSGVAF